MTENEHFKINKNKNCFSNLYKTNYKNFLII